MQPLNLVLAYEAKLSFYTFENKGTNTFGKIVLGSEFTPIPITVPWFDWKCSGQKQIDGMLISCERGEEKTETKIFCYVGTSDNKIRSLHFAKGANFVSIEGRCKLDKAKKKIKPAGA